MLCRGCLRAAPVAEGIMEIFMGIMMLVMIIGFSVFGHHQGMMGGHDKECPKEEQVIKHDGHEKDDCKEAMESQEDRAIDKGNY
ncbi:MAG: hypothetical protein A2X87_06180 [Deltaproteobacteria bacterium GWC2_42_51]|nr:MAG: hypothetical protein A2X87_06180 [Deltaproteobacteria bacterium GWC2_42_51]OGP39137.1 MAG: hypothetical protein A2090_00730 [Deltaproteobacteria bacterium GWD2_42_10]OGP47868.1 MAG: hypothetical protein A2022_03080 [Deltaproteobacteria bacterium GWF2_42_12]OGQ28848.1 MAG: hypothetical protein A3D29_01560 [Deltaproteobacteria bacterium RIFCSPHIGHO2_02_FULL_42_44]OGQ65711.1 MAG: hypothetical protein A3F88_00460 [Deltaproteobacteria bacterium RIFCSPLOWO2_12_FULL_42_16]HAG51957.1 hypotheti